MARIIVLLLVSFLSLSALFSQSKPEEEGAAVSNPNPGSRDSARVDKEPSPVNLNEIKGLIGYPPMAKEAEIEGKVVVQIHIDEQGVYIKHIILKDPHPILTKAVTNQIHKLKFNPGTVEGKPSKFWVTIPFDFKLSPKNDIPPPPVVIAPVLENPEVLAENMKKKVLAGIPAEKAYVNLRVKVSAQGNYMQHVIMESPSQEVSNAVDKKASKLKFQPGKFDGVQKDCWTVVTVKLKAD